MASVYVLTTRPMDEQVKNMFYQELCSALEPTFSLYSLMLQNIPASHANQAAKDHTAIFICVPPYMDIERRRNVVHDLSHAVERVFHCPGDPKTTIMFPYHTDDCCGKHGTLRSDAATQKTH